jgi:hypothetical protein
MTSPPRAARQRATRTQRAASPRLATVLLLAAIAVSSLAGKKSKGETPEPAPNGFAGGFIDIDLSEEEEALDAAAIEDFNHAAAECGDLQALETTAMLGGLADAQIRCLDEGLKVAERQTVKNKINRVLLNDAWAKGDEHRWEAIAIRHVTEINRSDPDMCYRLAFYLVDRGPERMDEAIKWADTALENRSAWEGDVYVKRVYSLHKFRSMASQKKWKALETDFATRRDDDALKAQVEEARSVAKTMAREWLDYAREAGKDLTLPMEYCRSSAGTNDFCVE